MATLPLEEVLNGCKNILQQQEEKKLRPQQDQEPLKCPRCESTNTKFCYYNNYSLTQPRYFCKGCRRYWTKGGSLRNVPVGGSCRKNKRSSSSHSSTSSNLPSKKLEHSNMINRTMPTHPASLPNILSLPPLSNYHDPNEFTIGQLLDHGNNTTTNTMNALPLANPNPSHAYLDIFKNVGMMDSGNYGCSLYSGYNVDEMHFGGGATTTLATTVTTSSAIGSDGGEKNKLLMGLQWPLHGNGSVALEPGARDVYRNISNGFGSNWHGLINNSLI